MKMKSSIAKICNREVFCLKGNPTAPTRSMLFGELVKSWQMNMCQLNSWKSWRIMEREGIWRARFVEKERSILTYQSIFVYLNIRIIFDTSYALAMKAFGFNTQLTHAHTHSQSEQYIFTFLPSWSLDEVLHSNF